MRLLTLANAAWLFLYLLLVATLVWALLGVRERVLRDSATPQAQGQWDEWRKEAERQANTGPVRRRMPGSDQPPALVLLRDHFPIVMAASIVFCSLLFGMTMVLLRGALSKPRQAAAR